jgi:hypothetical protein
MGVFDQIRADWAVLKTAPLAFAGLLIAGLVGGFLAGTTFRDQQVANAEGLAKLKLEENAKLTADVKTLEARIAELEKQLVAIPQGEVGTRPFPDLLPIDPNAPIKAHKPKAESSTTWPPAGSTGADIEKLIPRGDDGASNSVAPSFE